MVIYERQDPIYGGWRPAGEYRVTSDDHPRGSWIGIDDDGYAVELPALNVTCQSSGGGREELLVFPLNHDVRVIKRGET